LSAAELEVSLKQLHQMKFEIKTMVMIAERWPGAPDSAILEELMRCGAALLTKDRPFHNTVLKAKGISFYLSPHQQVTRRPLKGIAANPILPGRDNLKPFPPADEQIMCCRKIVTDLQDERLMKKLRTRRRRIRNKVGGAQNIESLAVTVTVFSDLIGLTLQVNSNCNIAAFRGSESFVRASKKGIADQALVEVLAVLLRLNAETYRIQVYYDRDAGIPKPTTCTAPLFRFLQSAFSALEWIECSKGRHIDNLRQTTRSLWKRPTNMITPSEYDQYEQRYAEIDPPATEAQTEPPALDSNTDRGALILAGKWFVEAVVQNPHVERVALCGSLTTAKEHPKDIDFLVYVSPEVDLKWLSKMKRGLLGRIQRGCLGADVFVVEQGSYIGRACRYRDPWPRQVCVAQDLTCHSRLGLCDTQRNFVLNENLVQHPPIVLYPESEGALKASEIPDDVAMHLMTRHEAKS
jgi:hypothetical protein